jgi:putative restriction endonuclease
MDALFDRGLISFQDDGNILISQNLFKKEREYLNLNQKRLSKVITEQTKLYLSHHRNQYGYD